MRLRSAKALTIIELSIQLSIQLIIQLIIQLSIRPGIELTLNEALKRARTSPAETCLA